MVRFTEPLESATRKKIDQILNNLGWNTDEFSSDYNVTTERVKTEEENKRLKKISRFKKPPDYVLYKTDSDEPLAIIEAKRKGQSVDDALEQAKERYAIPLGIKIVFAYDGTFIKSLHLQEKKPLTIDGDLLTELPSEERLIRFLEQGSEIEEVTEKVKHTREELIKIFK